MARSSPPTREAIERRVLPGYLSFGYLLRQIFRREHLGTLTAAARKDFEPSAAQLPAEERGPFLDTVSDAATLGRINALVLLHRSLKVWLAPHVLTTSLMLALMIVHIIQVVYFAVK